MKLGSQAIPPLFLLFTCACDTAAPLREPGISIALARQRHLAIRGLHYELSFAIPATRAERIRGTVVARFELGAMDGPLLFDFRAPAGDVLAVRVGTEAVPYEVGSEHISIPAEALAPGEVAVSIDFLAGELSLNRNEEYLYTLFVPDRASTAFPVFDQPDLKARYALELETPAAWQAVANAPLERRVEADGRATWTFAETAPISTYLFAFAAGVFAVEEAERDGRRMRMLHRETDTAKLARNRETLFDLHASALAWLEEYTAIPYPFAKFDFVLVPAFQYSGMEHPGAILYRAEKLLLEEAATQEQELGRASLIAHETAHMWFGDLVTMRWFDDVWTKEVFANFMAAKIVNPSFPALDHDLRFFLRHYPSAYAVDRTAGANPIRQPLENLNEAGSLYGAIIYQKAPIVMRQLERLMGEEELRDGLREYLTRFRFANSSWPELIEILDRRCAEDLAAWSAVWVDEPERPEIEIVFALGADGAISRLELVQRDPGGRGRIWKQHLEVTLGWEDRTLAIPVYLDAPRVAVAEARGLNAPRFSLAAGGGLGYGRMALDVPSRTYLLASLERLPDAMSRAAAWVSLWDEVLAGAVTAEEFLVLLQRALPLESEEQVIQHMLSYLRTAYWRFLPATPRAAMSPTLEELLWGLVERAPGTSLKVALFRCYRSIAISDEGVARLARIWRGQLEVAGMPLAERDLSALAEAAAVRGPRGEAILDAQIGRIENPDRKARLEYLRPALAASPAVRDLFFASLFEERNREREPWVLDALRHLHHPLRAARAERYITPALELLEEIQRSGDIFFPKGWLDATLGGHSSPAAAAMVRAFLEARPEYPPRLRAKILQSADLLFRAARVKR